MRLFIALPLPREIEELLGKIIFVLKQKGGGRIKWVAPKNIHLTVKFLGETGEEKLEGIKSSMAAISGKYPAANCAVDKVGAFPDLIRPRVIWAGLSGDIETIQSIVNDIEDGMAEIGFAREDKRFKPHITLGRVKENYGLGDLVSYIKGYTMAPEVFKMGTLVLFKSTLTPKGPIYERLFEAGLIG